jgi:hypothetical protein
MEQIYNCASCGAPITFGEKYCGECGALLDWSFLQTAPPSPPDPYSYQQPDSQQVWDPYQQSGMPQQQGNWNQAPVQQQGMYQYPAYNQPQGPVPPQQKGGKGKTGSAPRKKGSPAIVVSLLGAMILMIIVGGIAFATNGNFFKLPSSNQPASQAPASKPQAETPQPETPSGPASVPVITSFKSSPSSIPAGDSTNLSWDVTGATSISIDQGVNNVAASGTQSVSPATTTTYKLTATSSAGSVTALATVKVVGTGSGLPVVTEFSASPVTITTGQSSSLKWNVTGATSISIDQGINTVSASGTQAISPTATTTYTISATNNSGTITASTIITVSAGTTGAPVINSFTANPSTITVGQSSTIRWNITGATSISIDNGVGSPSLNSTPTISPTSTTTYTLTATNSAGSTTATATLTVTQPGVPVITSFTASPSAIASGQSSTLQWNITGATSFSIDQGIGTVTASGNRTVSPTTTTTYTLTANNSAGIVTATATITLAQAGVPAITSFTANPITITTGQSSTLQWNVTGATSVSIDQGIGTVTATSNRTVTPTATTIYTLTATNSAGTSTATATVTIGQAGSPVITSFTANPTTLPTGQIATLQWVTSGATSVTIDQSVGAVNASGSKTVSPIATTTYTLTATNSASSVTATTTVTLTQGSLPVIVSFTASPATISYGQSTNLIWNVTGATSITIEPGVGTMSFGNQKSVNPTTTTTYTATATNSAGSVTASTTVTVQ